MQGRGLDGRAHDLKTIAKHTTRKAWFDEVWDAEVEAAAAEGLLLLTPVRTGVCGAEPSI